MTDQINHQWRTDWSRHYDKVQWTGTSILTAAVSILLVYSNTQGKFDPWLAFVGLWLTWLTVYYAASFRKFRRELLEGLPDCPEKSFLKNDPRRRVLAQWPLFLATFVMLTAGWVWGYWTNGYLYWAVGFGAASVVGFAFLARLGRGI